MLFAAEEEEEYCELDDDEEKGTELELLTQGCCDCRSCWSWKDIPFSIMLIRPMVDGDSIGRLCFISSTSLKFLLLIGRLFGKPNTILLLLLLQALLPLPLRVEESGEILSKCLGEGVSEGETAVCTSLN